jgi:hypothetical protein
MMTSDMHFLTEPTDSAGLFDPFSSFYFIFILKLQIIKQVLMTVFLGQVVGKIYDINA